MCQSRFTSERVLSLGSSNPHTRLFTEKRENDVLGPQMSLKEAIALMSSQEYGRAISILEEGASSDSKSPSEKAELCAWVAECHRQLQDYKMCGDWYLEAVKRIFSQQGDVRSKAKQALPLSEKALESYKLGGDTVDVLEAAKLKQRLLDLSR